MKKIYAASLAIATAAYYGDTPPSEVCQQDTHNIRDFIGTICPDVSVQSVVGLYVVRYASSPTPSRYPLMLPDWCVSEERAVIFVILNNDEVGVYQVEGNDISFGVGETHIRRGIGNAVRTAARCLP